jgi:hypothetical protein
MRLPEEHMWVHHQEDNPGIPQPYILLEGGGAVF